MPPDLPEIVLDDVPAVRVAGRPPFAPRVSWVFSLSSQCCSISPPWTLSYDSLSLHVPDHVDGSEGWDSMSGASVANSRCLLPQGNAITTPVPTCRGQSSFSRSIFSSRERVLSSPTDMALDIPSSRTSSCLCPRGGFALPLLGSLDSTAVVHRGFCCHQVKERPVQIHDLAV